MDWVRRLRIRSGYAWSIGRRWGMVRFVLMAVRGLLDPLVGWRTFDFFARDLTAPISSYESPSALEIRVAREDDFVQFRKTLLGENTTWNEIERRRAAGDRCFLGVSEGRLVHFTWLTRQRQVWLAGICAMLHLEGDEAYVTFSYTEPAMRGRSVQAAVTHFMIRWEQEAGVRRHFYVVMRHNLPARAITRGRHVGSRAEALQTVRTVRVAGLRGLFVQGLRDGHLRLEPLRPVDLHGLGVWIRRPSASPNGL